MSGSSQPLDDILSTTSSFSGSHGEPSLLGFHTRVAADMADVVPLTEEHTEIGAPTSEPPYLVASDETAEWHIPREYVEDAGQALPALTEELVEAQATQNNELLRREQQLERLQNELEEEVDRRERIQSDISRASKSICLCREETAKLTDLCSQLEKEMALIVTENSTLSLKLKLAEEEAVKNDSMFEQQRTKMAAHREAAKIVERGLPIQQELERIQTKLADLKDKRAGYITADSLRVLSGERQRELLETLQEVNKARSLVSEENSQLRVEIQQLQQRQSQLQSSVEVGRKRRQAQLTRLHHQLQEAQARRKQWVEQAKRKQGLVAALRQTIEE